MTANEKISKTQLIDLVSDLIQKHDVFSMDIIDDNHGPTYGLIAINPFSDDNIDFIIFGSYDNTADGQNGHFTSRRGCISVGPSEAENKERVTAMLVSLPDTLTINVDDEL